jgi:hypothetical protein
MTASAGEQCPSCGAHMAIDQRYCLECGQRRGDPRLPFMDAVVFMNASRAPKEAAVAPAAAREPRSRMTANASLIAGVATASSAPQIIRVGGSGGEEAAATASTAGGGQIDGKGGKAKKGKPPEKAIDSSGTSEAAAEVLKPAGDVKLPPPTVQKGGDCESGAAGCEDGEFTGDFFGE